MSSSASHGMSSSRRAHERVPHARRQQATDARDDPDRDLRVAGDRRRGARSRDADEPARAERRGLEEHAGRCRPPRRRGRTSARRSHRPPSAAAAARGRSPRPSASMTSTSRSPRRGSASPICSGQPSTRPSPRRESRGRARSGVRVVGDLVGGAPRLGHRVFGGQHPGRQPPQRTRRRVAVDDAAACGDQPGRVEAERRERARRLPHEQPVIGPRSACHVAQALDGVHRRTLPRVHPARSGHGAVHPAESHVQALPSAAVAHDPSGDLQLTPLEGDAAHRPRVAHELPPAARLPSTRTRARARGCSTPPTASWRCSPRPTAAWRGS